MSQNDKWKRGPFNIPLLAVITALLLILVSWLANSKIEQGIKGEIGDTLVTIRNTAYQSLLVWTRDHRATAQILASTPEIMRFARELLAVPRRQELLESSVQENIRSFLSPTLRRRDYRGFFIIGRDRMILSASRDVEIGNENSLRDLQPFLDKLQEGHTFVTLPMFYSVPLESGRFEPVQTIFVGTPIQNDEGLIIAYLVMRIDPWQEFNAIFQRGQLGKTGETFAFGPDGLLISESRFESQLQRTGRLETGQHSMLRVFVRKPEDIHILKSGKDMLQLTRLAAKAVEGEDGIDLNGYIDYRGVEVVGAWIGVGELGYGIATKIDVDEIFQSLRITRFILWAETAFALLLLLVLTLLSMADQRHQRAAQSKLQQANRELDAFVYTLCHDLRSHLTPVIGYADFLKTSGQNRLEQNTLDLLDKISSSGQRMVLLMEDLLNLAKIGKLERPADPVDTRELVDQVVYDLTGQASPSGSAIKVGSLPSTYIPGTLLAQIFTNLIGNALHYGCHNGCKVEVGGERKGATVRFYVRDHGPGVPPEERARIFDVFYRGSTGKEISGTGIGLATVQKIANLYRGRAWIDDTPGGGCTFWVEMMDDPAEGKAKE